jgi:hypothetical protein
VHLARSLSVRRDLGVVWIVIIFFGPIVAWGMWLGFCAVIAKMLGIDGLKATPPIAKAFPVTQWVNALRHIVPWLTGILGRTSRQALPPGEDGPSST